MKDWHERLSELDDGLVEWNERFGWRAMTETERHANYWFWRGVGELMDLTVIPPSYDEARQFKADYEARHFRRTGAGVELVEMLFALLESWQPRGLRWTVRPLLSTLVDEPFHSYFDLKPPPRWLCRTVHAVMRMRSRVAAKGRSKQPPRFYTDGPIRSYPDGYALNDLGPPDDWSDRDGIRGADRLRTAGRDDQRYCHHDIRPAAEIPEPH